MKNSKKETRKKRLRYFRTFALFLILFVFWLIFLIIDISHGGNWGKVIKDAIWTIILGLAAFFSYEDLRKNGTSKFIDDDERDKFVEMKTDSLMYKISVDLIAGLGVIALGSGMILGKQAASNDFLVMTLTIIGIAFLLIWNLLLIIWLVVYFINEARD